MNVRRAIASAVDRETIASRVYFGLLDPTGTIAPPSAWWYDAQADRQVRFDLDAAKQHLQASKYPKGFSFELTIPSTAYLLDVGDAALVVQSQLAKIGITAKLKVMEFAPLLQSIIAGGEPASMWVQMSPGEPTYLVQNCLTPGQAIYNSTKNPDPRVGAYLKQAFATTDREKLKPIYADMARFLADLSPIVWIGFVQAANVWRDRVHGFEVNQGLTIDPRPIKL